ncbi:hypothetical protein AGDE_13116 [Angomonas deanei]|nr:hypothetical protein AGDE_13116 [Angomonas deanei]|eukprot:EPY22710.1 hypothetical protein AGDE_13116 [Angomonas deanei]
MSADHDDEWVTDEEEELQEEEEEESVDSSEERVCWICRGAVGDSGSSCYCGCRGSLSIVHDDCIRDWVLGRQVRPVCASCRLPFKVVYLDSEGRRVMAPQAILADRRTRDRFIRTQFALPALAKLGFLGVAILVKDLMTPFCFGATFYLISYLCTATSTTVVTPSSVFSRWNGMNCTVFGALFLLALKVVLARSWSGWIVFWKIFSPTIFTEHNHYSCTYRDNKDSTNNTNINRIQRKNLSATDLIFFNPNITFYKEYILKYKNVHHLYEWVVYVVFGALHVNYTYNNLYKIEGSSSAPYQMLQNQFVTEEDNEEENANFQAMDPFLSAMNRTDNSGVDEEEHRSYFFYDLESLPSYAFFDQLMTECGPHYHKKFVLNIRNSVEKNENPNNNDDHDERRVPKKRDWYSTLFDLHDDMPPLKTNIVEYILFQLASLRLSLLLPKNYLQLVCLWCREGFLWPAFLSLFYNLCIKKFLCGLLLRPMVVLFGRLWAWGALNTSINRWKVIGYLLLAVCCVDVLVSVVRQYRRPTGKKPEKKKKEKKVRDATYYETFRYRSVFSRRRTFRLRHVFLYYVLYILEFMTFTMVLQLLQGMTIGYSLSPYVFPYRSLPRPSPEFTFLGTIWYYLSDYVNFGVTYWTPLWVVFFYALGVVVSSVIVLVDSMMCSVCAPLSDVFFIRSLCINFEDAIEIEREVSRDEEAEEDPVKKVINRRIRFLNNDTETETPYDEIADHYKCYRLMLTQVSEFNWKFAFHYMKSFGLTLCVAFLFFSLPLHLLVRMHNKTPHGWETEIAKHQYFKDMNELFWPVEKAEWSAKYHRISQLESVHDVSYYTSMKLGFPLWSVKGTWDETLNSAAGHSSPPNLYRNGVSLRVWVLWQKVNFLTEVFYFNREKTRLRGRQDKIESHLTYYPPNTVHAFGGDLIGREQPWKGWWSAAKRLGTEFLVHFTYDLGNYVIKFITSGPRRRYYQDKLLSVKLNRNKTARDIERLMTLHADVVRGGNITDEERKTQMMVLRTLDWLNQLAEVNAFQYEEYNYTQWSNRIGSFVDTAGVSTEEETMLTGAIANLIHGRDRPFPPHQDVGCPFAINNTRHITVDDFYYLLVTHSFLYRMTHADSEKVNIYNGQNHNENNQLVNYHSLAGMFIIHFTPYDDTSKIYDYLFVLIRGGLLRYPIVFNTIFQNYFVVILLVSLCFSLSYFPVRFTLTKALYLFLRHVLVLRMFPSMEPYFFTDECVTRTEEFLETVRKKNINENGERVPENENGFLDIILENGPKVDQFPEIMIPLSRVHSSRLVRLENAEQWVRPNLFHLKKMIIAVSLLLATMTLVWGPALVVTYYITLPMFDQSNLLIALLLSYNLFFLLWGCRRFVLVFLISTFSVFIPLLWVAVTVVEELSMVMESYAMTMKDIVMGITTLRHRRRVEPYSKVELEIVKTKLP